MHMAVQTSANQKIPPGTWILARISRCFDLPGPRNELTKHDPDNDGRLEHIEHHPVVNIRLCSQHWPSSLFHRSSLTRSVRQRLPCILDPTITVLHVWHQQSIRLLLMQNLLIIFRYVDRFYGRIKNEVSEKMDFSSFKISAPEITYDMNTYRSFKHVLSNDYSLLKALRTSHSALTSSQSILEFCAPILAHL